MSKSHTDYPNKIGLGTDNKEFLLANHDIVLNWPYKDCMLEGKQTKESAKGEEVFYHQTIAAKEIGDLLAPKVFTNWQYHTIAKRANSDTNGQVQCAGSGTNKQAQRNIEIPSTITAKDNLIIKGNNLIALHSLRPRYAGKVKLIYIDVPFNTGDDSFCYNDNFTHSTWLTFMKNRLEVAKDFLTDDGSIFIHADWHEVHYLKVLCDEILGRENFINEIIWCYTGPGSPQMQQLNRKHDTILWYANDPDDFTFNKDAVRVPYTSAYQSMRKSLNAGDGWTDEDVARMREKGRVPDDWWSDIAVAARIPIDGKKRTGYMTEKPVKLMERIIKMASNPGEIVLDFFAGSGTTPYMAAQLGRQFVAVEQLNGAHRIMLQRLEGEANFISCTLEHGTQNNSADEKSLYINYSEIDKCNISDTDKKINKIFYAAE